MTRGQAGELFALLCANYAHKKVPDDTADLWLDALAELDYSLGEAAVRGVITVAKTWPGLAYLHEQVSTVRLQVIRERRDAERRAEQEAWAQMPQLQTIPPEAVALFERWEARPLGLEQVEDGACDECSRKGPRFQLGKVELCARCAGRRTKVAERLASSEEAAA